MLTVAKERIEAIAGLAWLALCQSIGYGFQHLGVVEPLTSIAYEDSLRAIVASSWTFTPKQRTR